MSSLQENVYWENGTLLCVQRSGDLYFSIIYEAPECNSSIKPYVVALIRTKDGLMIASQVSDVNLEDVEIGMPVRAVLRELDSNGGSGVIHYGYKFVPV